GGSGLPGRSATRLTQCVGIASSPSRNLVGSLISGVGVERERARVHAPALARRARAVVEDVAQVAAAARAAHLGARHAVAAVLEQLDVGRVGRLGEARPARARFALRVRAEQLRTAAGAAVGAVVVVVYVGAGERALGRAVAQHLVGLGGQLGAPLLVGLGDLGHR